MRIRRKVDEVQYIRFLAVPAAHKRVQPRDMEPAGRKVSVHLGHVNQGRSEEYVDPGVTPALHSSFAPPTETRKPTDFTTWTQQEIIEFLDRRGEDHGDCMDFYAFVARAHTCEENTGPATKPSMEGGNASGEPDEEDALEAFMADLESVENEISVKRSRVVDDCDEPDAMAEYIQAHAAKKTRETSNESALEGNTIQDSSELTPEEQAALREIQPLDPVDHASITYPPFKKNFYDESPDVFALDDKEVDDIRRDRQIHVSGVDVPKPVTTFEQCGFAAKLMAAIKQAGFQKPTDIQAQVLPVRSSSIQSFHVRLRGARQPCGCIITSCRLG